MLALSDGEAIQGLVVMVVDRSEEGGAELVFANIAGAIDLAAIQQIGEGFNVPGLDGLDLEGAR